MVRQTYQGAAGSAARGDKMTDNILIDVYFEQGESYASPGRLTGILATFGELASDRPDIFDRGALVWDDGGFVLNEAHNRQAPITRITPILDGDTLRVDHALPATQRGRDAAVLIADKTLTGLSVELERASIRATTRGGIRHISYAKIVGAGLVDKAAFTGSTVEVHAQRQTNVLGCLAWL